MTQLSEVSRMQRNFNRRIVFFSMADKRENFMNQSKKADAPALATGPDDQAQLLKQYGCGSIPFAETENASYGRHLPFDNVINPAAATDRERFEAVANAPANERATCRLVENSSVGCRPTLLGVHRSSEARFNPEEWKTPGEDKLAPAEHARNDEATNRWDADSETDARVASRKESSKERGETIITLYLREIGRVKLLTPQEEIELANRIKQGDREAREQMIKANLRLVVKIARSYEGMGMPLLDLISEGNIGLMRAVERFDPGKGAKLSAYSAWWIKHAITQAFANQSKVTRVPVYVMEKLGKMRRVALRLQEELDRDPTDEELAAEMGTTASRITRMRMAVVEPVSLDAETNGEGSRSYAEVIADERTETPGQKLENETQRAMVRQIIDTLTHREQAVLHSRFGLNGHDPKNLEETGKELNITDERVRQIQNGAFVKLRRRLKNFEQGLICEAGGNGNIR